MLAFAIALVAFTAVEGPAYRPPRPPTRPSAPVAGPDASLSDAAVRARVTSYLQSIDVPVTADQWRALGPRAVPLLEEALANAGGLPSRRAAAVAGLAVIGGRRARELVLETAHAENEPFAVRVAALQGAAQVLRSRELVRELRPVLEHASQPAARAAAAEVLAQHAPRSACSAIRAQARREGEAQAHFERALQRCGSAP